MNLSRKWLNEFVQVDVVQAAHHAVGQHTPQLAPLDVLAAGQGGVMEGHRRQIAHVNVPRPGAEPTHQRSLETTEEVLVHLSTQ